MTEKIGKDPRPQDHTQDRARQIDNETLTESNKTLISTIEDSLHKLQSQGSFFEPGYKVLQEVTTQLLEINQIHDNTNVQEPPEELKKIWNLLASSYQRLGLIAAYSPQSNEKYLLIKTLSDPGLQRVLGRKQVFSLVNEAIKPETMSVSLIYYLNNHYFDQFSSEFKAADRESDEVFLKHSLEAISCIPGYLNYFLNYHCPRLTLSDIISLLEIAPPPGNVELIYEFISSGNHSFTALVEALQDHNTILKPLFLYLYAMKTERFFNQKGLGQQSSMSHNLIPTIHMHVKGEKRADHDMNDTQTTLYVSIEAIFAARNKLTVWEDLERLFKTLQPVLRLPKEKGDLTGLIVYFQILLAIFANTEARDPIYQTYLKNNPNNDLYRQIRKTLIYIQRSLKLHRKDSPFKSLIHSITQDLANTIHQVTPYDSLPVPFTQRRILLTKRNALIASALPLTLWVGNADIIPNTSTTPNTRHSIVEELRQPFPRYYEYQSKFDQWLLTTSPGYSDMVSMLSPGQKIEFLESIITNLDEFDQKPDDSREITRSIRLGLLTMVIGNMRLPPEIGRISSDFEKVAGTLKAFTSKNPSDYQIYYVYVYEFWAQILAAETNDPRLDLTFLKNQEDFEGNSVLIDCKDEQVMRVLRWKIEREWPNIRIWSRSFSSEESSSFRLLLFIPRVDQKL